MCVVKHLDDGLRPSGVVAMVMCGLVGMETCKLQPRVREGVTSYCDSTVVLDFLENF
jgi:hypothetical protein